ncbi:MAG: hypothetical protein H6791_00165 [Candidatus Nomurabacteria bacterium]|nr:MAG: hypothetical protein H6791_00165 [Candidatus Nomurabacteria bacterium]
MMRLTSDAKKALSRIEKGKEWKPERLSKIKSFNDIVQRNYLEVFGASISNKNMQRLVWSSEYISNTNNLSKGSRDAAVRSFVVEIEFFEEFVKELEKMGNTKLNLIVFFATRVLGSAPIGAISKLHLEFVRDMTALATISPMSQLFENLNNKLLTLEEKSSKSTWLRQHAAEIRFRGFNVVAGANKKPLIEE